VLRITGGTSGLADVIAHHRDDGVIAHASFPRAVVVDDVTNPGLALRHEESPGKAFQSEVGW
jgi:hypothetical protein